MKARALVLPLLLACGLWEASRGFAVPTPGRPQRGFTGCRECRTLRRAEQETASSSKFEEPVWQTVLFAGYFFGQNGMAYLMKRVLSQAQVAKGLFGVPASFLVVASQQLVSFCILLCIFAALRVIRGKDFKFTWLKRKDWPLLLGLSAAFSLNIGFNLLALSLLPLSLSLIIRSCSPISTSLLQSVWKDPNSKQDSISRPEWLCLGAGVVCAALVTVAQSGMGLHGAASKSFWMGVCFSVGSIWMGALDFVIKSKLGKGPKLSALETNFYNAIPVAMITACIGTLLPTPVPMSWATRYGTPLTDLTVFKKVWEVNPLAFRDLVALSGVCACAFNFYVTFLVVKLSPATGAFAGNFNKSMSILLSFFLLERAWPHDLRGWVKMGAVLGNIAAFYAYNVLKRKRKSAK